jgi:hypothetical protein
MKNTKNGEDSDKMWAVVGAAATRNHTTAFFLSVDRCIRTKGDQKMVRFTCGC